MRRSQFIIVTIAALWTAAGWASPFVAEQVSAQTALTACVQRLPSALRHAFAHPAERRRVRIAAPARPQWQQCIERERDLRDAQESQRLFQDLMRMLDGTPAAERQVAEHEAVQIVRTLVTTTRARAPHYNMMGSPLFNNFLIKLGAKEAGYCYHWTKDFVRALADLPFRIFEHQWAVAYVGHITENNGVAITRRGAPLETGLVYDAWRGSGRPYWRWVTDDHYRWRVRMTEPQLLMGAAEGIQER